MKDNRVIVHLCGVDWQHEIDACPTVVYPSVESAKNGHPPWDSCGIVEAEMSFVKWVEPQDVGKNSVSFTDAVRHEGEGYAKEIEEIRSVRKRQKLGPALTKRLKAVEYIYERWKKNNHVK